MNNKHVRGSVVRHSVSVPQGNLGLMAKARVDKTIVAGFINAKTNTPVPSRKKLGMEPSSLTGYVSGRTHYYAFSVSIGITRVTVYASGSTHWVIWGKGGEVSFLLPSSSFFYH